MEQNILTFKEWKEFEQQLFKKEGERNANASLTKLCLDFIPSTAPAIKKSAFCLFSKLSEQYQLKNIDLSDIQSFLNKAWLLSTAYHYIHDGNTH